MKRILIGVAAALCVAATARAQAPAPSAPERPVYETTKVADGVYQFRYQFYNAMFVVTPAGVIVTDPIAFRRPEAAQAYMAEIRKITAAPIRYLIYSHSHFDHATGGQIFKDAGAIVIAQTNAKTRLMKVSYPEIVMPDETVDTRRMLTLGGTELELLYLGRNHSDNMLVMRLPRQKVLFAVDWIGVGTPPAIAGMGPDTYPDEWVEGLRKVVALDWDKLIPGHGDRLGTKADVELQIDWMSTVKALAKPLADSGKCNADGFAATPIPPRFQAYTPAATWPFALNRYCQYWNQGF